ncbi:MAG: hypothetical protein H0W72_04805 [Planctomycetes bacterium]|nr:hypothetical protein [Planctomycetota bacterium]
MEVAEIAHYFATCCLALGDVEGAKQAAMHAERARRASRYPDRYNGILGEREVRRLDAALRDADQSESAQNARWAEAERARVAGSWREAASAYGWVVRIAADTARKHDAAWRA